MGAAQQAAIVAIVEAMASDSRLARYAATRVDTALAGRDPVAACRALPWEIRALERDMGAALAGAIADCWARDEYRPAAIVDALAAHLGAMRAAGERMRHAGRIQGRELLPTAPPVGARPMPSVGVLKRGTYRGIPREWSGERPATYATIPRPDDPRVIRFMRDAMRDAMRAERERKATTRGPRRDVAIVRSSGGTVSAGGRRRKRKRRR